MIYPDTFNNDRRFIFSNWSKDDFTVQHLGQPETIKAGEVKEYTMAKAYHICKHFVDRELMRVGKEAFMAVEEQRAPLEARTITEITGDVESPALANLKAKIAEEVKTAIEPKAKVVKKAKKEEVVEEVKEFADLNN